MREKCGLASAVAPQEGKEREGEDWFGLWLQAAPLTPETAGQPGPRARASLLWKAVAEMIWADDMAAMLCRALSFAAWSWGRQRKARPQQGRSGRLWWGTEACGQGSCPTARGQSPGLGPSGPGLRPCTAATLFQD